MGHTIGHTLPACYARTHKATSIALGPPGAPSGRQPPRGWRSPRRRRKRVGFNGTPRTHMQGRRRFSPRASPDTACRISPEAGALAQQSARTEARDISGGIAADVRAAGRKDFRAMDSSHYLPAARANAIV